MRKPYYKTSRTGDEIENKPKNQKIQYSFYCYWHQNYLMPEPIILEADDLEQATEMFYKDYSDYSIHKITYLDKEITGFGMGPVTI